MTGSRRSVHFTPPVPGNQEIKPELPNKLGNGTSAAQHPKLSDPIEERHALTLYGDLSRDLQLLRRELAKLPFDQSGLHGRLQVMRGATIRMREACDQLIADLEIGGGPC